MSSTDGERQPLVEAAEKTLDDVATQAEVKVTAVAEEAAEEAERFRFKNLLAERPLKIILGCLLAFSLLQAAMWSQSFVCVLATATVCVIGGFALSRQSSLLLLAFIVTALMVAALYIAAAILILCQWTPLASNVTSQPVAIISAGIQAFVLGCASGTGLLLRKHVGRQRANSAESAAKDQEHAPLSPEGGPEALA